MTHRFTELADLADETHEAENKFWSDKYAELVLEDAMRILRNNGYDDAAKCLHDVYIGMDDPV